MRCLPRSATVLAAALLAAFPAFAQGTSGTTTAAPVQDRFYLSFVEDPTLAQRQWWEVRGEFADGGDDNPVDTVLARFVVAIQPIKGLELGGDVGFGSTDAPPGFEDGTGATDLDFWGKWRFGTSGDTSFAAGLVATIPTGDDSVGLGFDAFSLKGFGSVRHAFGKMVLVADAGVKLNEDGQVGGRDLDGKTSASIAGGVLFPISKSFSVLGEAYFETERFEQTDTDARLLGGLNWRPGSNGVVRGAVSFGLTDYAPDVEILAGYAFTF